MYYKSNQGKASATALVLTTIPQDTRKANLQASFSCAIISYNLSIVFFTRNEILDPMQRETKHPVRPPRQGYKDDDL